MSKFDELKKLAEAATPGPWKAAMESTCSGAWPVIVCDVDCADDEEPTDIAELSTSHVETDDARESEEFPGTFMEKPHRFVLKEEFGQQRLSDAAFIAAANPAAILELLAIKAQLVEALGRIYKNECEVFDEETNGMVICCMDTDDMMEVARAALAAAGAQP